MKTYFDLLLSKKMSSAFSSLAFVNLLIFSILYIFDSEFKVIQCFSKVINLGFAHTYWLVTLLLSCIAIAGNILVLVKYSRSYIVIESDLTKSIEYLNRERKTSEVFSGKVVYQSYPKLLITIFLVIILFSVYIAVSNIIISPLFELSNNGGNKQEVTKLDMSYFFGLGVMSYIPGYIIVVIRMLHKSFISWAHN